MELRCCVCIHGRLQLNWTQNGSCMKITISSHTFRGAAESELSAFYHQHSVSSCWNEPNQGMINFINKQQKNPQEDFEPASKPPGTNPLCTAHCSNSYLAVSPHKAIWLWFLSTTQHSLFERLENVSGQKLSNSEQLWTDWDCGVRTIITDAEIHRSWYKSKLLTREHPSLPKSEQICSILKRWRYCICSRHALLSNGE